MLTTLWLLALFTYAFASWGKIAKLEPNAVGDLLAGAFAPLAFAWLVVAVFLQRSELQAQRKELKQNREALMLQAKELHNSVAQQKALVEATTEEFKRAQIAHQELRFNDPLNFWSLKIHTLVMLGPETTYVVDLGVPTVHRVFNYSPEGILVNARLGRINELFQSLMRVARQLVSVSKLPHAFIHGHSLGHPDFVRVLEDIASSGRDLVQQATNFPTTSGLVAVKSNNIEELIDLVEQAVINFSQHTIVAARWQVRET